LAGLVHVCGLPENISQAPDAVRLYDGSEDRIVQERRRRGLPATDETDHGVMDPVAKDFKARNNQPCAVDFLGLWDTVKAYGWLRPKSFPALRHNPSVRIVRHAPALDERRALFKMKGWAIAIRKSRRCGSLATIPMWVVVTKTGTPVCRMRRSAGCWARPPRRAFN
jgi:uncharacterized protein (DUF2235 family)